MSELRCEYCETVFDISEKERLMTEIELLKAKTRYLHDVDAVRELYEDALRAMRAYANR